MPDHHPRSPFGSLPDLRGAVDLSALGGGGGPAADDLTHGIDLYDSEVDAIDRVSRALAERTDVARNYDQFDHEIKQRFEDIGFVVDVVWHHTNVEGVKSPEVVIKARTEAIVFDRDRQVHEVTHDLLGLGEGGVIKTDPGVFEAMQDGTYKGHSDGHQH